MAPKKVAPMFNEEWLKAHPIETDKYGFRIDVEEQIAAAEEEGRKFREEQEALIKEIGIEAYVKNLVKDAKDLIKGLEDPNSEDRKKYTEEFIQEIIERQKEFIKNADKLIANYKKLNTEEKREVAEELGQYMKLPQGTHTNNLARNLTTKIKDPAQLDLTGKATITTKDFRLYIEGYDKLVNGANTSAVKFFDAAVITCSRNRDPLARIPLKEYMELRGLKDEKEARKQIKADMEVLKAVKFEYKGTGKGRGDWLSLSLYGGRAGIYRGVIEFRFTPEFYASIPENQFMFIPKEYFSTRDRYNPHTAYFIRRIAEHKRMNLGKPNENIIGVETLVNASPLFPKYEDVYYQFTQKILEPFERDMDAITSIKWHYAGDPPTNYTEFITSSVVITWVDYPDVLKLTQRKKNSLNRDDTNKKRSKKRG
jgi:hypothetical protein